MTDITSYLSAVFSSKKNANLFQKDEQFAMVARTSNKNILISRSALTGLLIKKLIRNPDCIQLPASKQKQCKQIMSRWNKIEIPRPLPIKINSVKYTAIANHLNQPFVATGDYDGSITIWKYQNYQYENSGKMLLRSKFLTIEKIVFHQSLPLVFAIDSKGNSKMWKIDSRVMEFWTPSRDITDIYEIQMHPTMPIVVISDKENTTVYILNEYGQEIAYIYLQDRYVTCMTFSKSGKHFAIGNSQGEIKLFFFEQSIDGSWIIYQTDSYNFGSNISNIVMTDKIIVFSNEKDGNLHVLAIDENSKLSESCIVGELNLKCYIDEIKLSDCEMFIYVRSTEYESYELNDSDDSDFFDDSDNSDNSDDSDDCRYSSNTDNSNYFEDLKNPSKISIFFLNIFNQIIQIGETSTTKTFLNFGRNGELICA